MNSFKEITTKHMGIYRCPDENILNFKVRLRVREISNDDSARNQFEEEIQSFEWQKKYFGRAERDFYREEKNCVTDLEKSYHEAINSSVDTNKLMYTYIEGDNKYFPIEKATVFSRKISPLEEELNKLHVSDKHSECVNNFHENLQYLIEHPCELNDFVVSMFVMTDFGEFVENIWLKFEYTMCVIKYYPTRKLLTIYPDFTVNSPYKLQVNSDTSKMYEIYIENVTEGINNKENVLIKENTLQKITSHNFELKLKDIAQTFEIPAIDKLRVFGFGGILTGGNFENECVSVEYFVDLPDGWSCTEEGKLRGETLYCQVNDKDSAHFGYNFDFCLEYDMKKIKENTILEVPCIYFEVTAKLSWNRYRVEGMSYQMLPIRKPGNYNYQMKCIRLLPESPIGHLRRHFIGDYKNYNDITWFAIPKECEGGLLNKFGVATTATCNLDIKIDIIHQSQRVAGCDKKSRGGGGDDDDVSNNRENAIFAKLHSANLLRSVEQVLADFKRAKLKMVQARKDLTV